MRYSVPGHPYFLFARLTDIGQDALYREDFSFNSQGLTDSIVLRTQGKILVLRYESWVATLRDACFQRPSA